MESAATAIGEALPLGDGSCRQAAVLASAGRWIFRPAMRRKSASLLSITVCGPQPAAWGAS